MRVYKNKRRVSYPTASLSPHLASPHLALARRARRKANRSRVELSRGKTFPDGARATFRTMPGPSAGYPFSHALMRDARVSTKRQTKESTANRRTHTKGRRHQIRFRSLPCANRRPIRTNASTFVFSHLCNAGNYFLAAEVMILTREFNVPRGMVAFTFVLWRGARARAFAYVT